MFTQQTILFHTSSTLDMHRHQMLCSSRSLSLLDETYSGQDDRDALPPTGVAPPNDLFNMIRCIPSGKARASLQLADFQIASGPHITEIQGFHICEFYNTCSFVGVLEPSLHHYRILIMAPRLRSSCLSPELVITDKRPVISIHHVRTPQLLQLFL
ncbi:hypothetical protein BDD12DRAFT_468491 [Trichophaea hybrida]|nr:hypothetical protein BDD12DRAFT_468491 [Trichophaea hybrida]